MAAAQVNSGYSGSVEGSRKKWSVITVPVRMTSALLESILQLKQDLKLAGLCENECDAIVTQKDDALRVLGYLLSTGHLYPTHFAALDSKLQLLLQQALDIIGEAQETVETFLEQRHAPQSESSPSCTEALVQQKVGWAREKVEECFRGIHVCVCIATDIRVAHGIEEVCGRKGITTEASESEGMQE